MGSATRESVSAAVAVLDAQPSLDLATGQQLLDAVKVVENSPHLRAALADDAAEAADRVSIVRALFGKHSKQAQAALESLASGRWSSADDLVAAIELLGIRAVAASAPASVSINDELFAFLTAVTSNADLELALGSKLGSAESRVALVNRLIAGKASAHTLAIVTALIASPRGRRIAELIRSAATIVAEQSSSTVATVTVAAPLSAAQRARLEKSLSAQYGSSIHVNEVVDPSILGGMRVHIGDEIIDGTIANRITDLRLRLAS
jgi:F-type H+-transporting ATPase subunit delta